MSVEDEDPLATALSHAFISSPSLRPEPPNSTQLAAASASTPTTSATESSVSSESLDSTSDAEYESHVESWRAQSAEAREKAEKERARWEAIRAAEKQEAVLRQAAIPDDGGAVGGEIISDHGWETVGKTQEVRRSSSPSPADARDLVTGEPQKHVAAPRAATVQNSQSAQDTGDESQKWEDVSSHLTSSFPSLSFPDRTNTPSPHPSPPPAPLESATLAIFDTSLSTRTRVTALFSSLAINFLLPFVNGVMLGFGEIFAKNIVLEYFGWRPLSPGTTAASRGLGATLRPSERTKSSFTSSAK